MGQRDRQIQAQKNLAAAAEPEAKLWLGVRDLFDRWVATDLQPRLRAGGKLRTAKVWLADLKQLSRFALARDVVL